MSQLSSVSVHDVQTIVQAKSFEASKFVKVCLYTLVLSGLVTFVLGLYGVFGEKNHAWMVLQINFIYWLFLSAAATCFAAVFQICNAKWSIPIRRILESAVNFFSFSALLLIPLYFGRKEIFYWANTEVPGMGKSMWLSANFVYLRDFFAILLLVFLSRRLIFLSLKRDIGAVRSGITNLPKSLSSRWFEGRYDKYVKYWEGSSHDALKHTNNQMTVLSPIVVMAYAFVMSLLAFDQVMSIDPSWYSTLFGAYLFMGGVYMAMAWTSIGVVFLRKHPLFKSKLDRKTLHDLGKLLFGFGIFWMYLSWSHYLTIWYANMPEETGFIINRLRLDPWHSVAWLVFGMCFIIPFLLGLSRDLKQVPVLLFLTGVIVAVGQWLLQFLLLMPVISLDKVPFGILEVLVTAGFAAAFILSCLAYLKNVPLIPFGALYVKDAEQE